MKRVSASVFAGGGVLGLVLTACTCSRSDSATAPAKPSASAVPAVTASAAAQLSDDLRAPSSWPVPSGLRLAILAGKGVGPIRFGATVATIERLMQIPCEVKTPDSCGYPGRAIDFILKDGVAVEMHLHRKDRTTEDGRLYGVFNGHTPEGVAFFMLPKATEELLGPPKKVEAVKEPGRWNMVEVRTYPGMRLEFDRIPNGNVVLGGIVLTRADVK